MPAGAHYGTGNDLVAPGGCQFGSRTPSHTQLARAAIPQRLETPLLSCPTCIQPCMENFLISPSFLALFFSLRCQRFPLTGRNTAAPCWGQMHGASGCKATITSPGSGCSSQSRDVGRETAFQPLQMSYPGARTSDGNDGDFGPYTAS